MLNFLTVGSIDGSAPENIRLIINTLTPTQLNAAAKIVPTVSD